MLTLHHLAYSQSFRILWLLEELGAEYELVKFERDPKTQLAPPEYKAISPLGSAPVITDGDFVLAESNAIVDHLLDRFPKDALRPAPGSPHRTRYLFWFHTAQGSMMPILVIDALFRIIGERAPFFLRPILTAVASRAVDTFLKPRMHAMLDEAEKDLATAPFFGGDTLTAADIVIGYPMEAAVARGYLTDEHPSCHAWLERVRATPSYRAAKQKDGKPSVVLSV